MLRNRLILASASPQRKMLLEGLGLTFDVIVPHGVDEQAHPELTPGKRALGLARLKAEDVAARSGGSWVIGCDTLVVSPDGQLFEKPADEKDARRMIAAQSGRTSVVHSGLCLLSPDGKRAEGVSSSQVTFMRMSAADIDWWIATGQWKDRSGSFQIDGLGQLMIEEIKGDWTSIVGFPVFLFGKLLRELKAPFLV
ncbi:MAG: Maf family protein [Candidatus Peribacteraceae bacterium]|nr:Maf family protein [Candidatus Peribacteraceae bacterium]